MLEKVKHNGHDGGRMELTLMRNWVMTHLIYEYILSLPEDAHDIEKGYIDRIIRTEARENRGGIMTELAMYRAEASAGNGVSLPRRVSKLFNVSNILPDGQSYSLLLHYLQNLWPDLNIQSDNSMEEGTYFYRSTTCRPLTYVRKDGIRYGSIANKRTKADSLAFISDGPNHRVPVEIIALLSVKLSGQPPHVCAVVHRMRKDDDIPALPWDLYASTLGIHTTYANEFDAPEVVSISKIDSPLALILVHSRVLQKDLCISVSFDHVGSEPNNMFEDNDNDD
ncbi:hypothetical protein BDZ94DRAFT_1310595 [Collybia nuda]|uniref:Uncharacterized protein n=1 Tax=Collybia nuda TaxID=64659 RepID=A0A9P6CI25_9AGAR|nr:hypothetical protein BDZ94DRAFT_1310595 [Collybia nuda]